MAEIDSKAAAALKNGSVKTKAGAAKLYALAKDPHMQARIKGLADEGKRLYRMATSPEAKRAYRQAAEFIKKTRKK